MSKSELVCIELMPFADAVSSILLSKSLSHILDVMGSRFVGLHELTSVAGLRGFAIITILCVFLLHCHETSC